MKVFVAFRLFDRTILGVFSTEDYAEQFLKSCGRGGFDVIISEHTVDEDVADMFGVDP